MTSLKNFVLYYGFKKEEYKSVRKIIDKDNFHNVRYLAVLMVILLMLHSITTLLFHHYDISHFYTFFGFLLVSVLIVWRLCRQHLKHYVLATKIVLIVLYVYGVIIGTVNTPTSNAVTLIVFLVLLPSIINNRFLETVILEIVSLVVFLTLSSYYKTGDFIRNDIVNSLSFTFVGILFHYLLSRNIIKGKLYELKNKKVMEELKKAKEVAETAAVAKESFLSNMSHDIRTPLNAVLGLTELALTQDEPSNSFYYFRKIKKSGTYLLGVLNDVLDMSKIQSGKIVIKEINCNFTEMMHDLSELMESKARKKQITVTTKIKDDVSEYQKFDKLHVMQILVNLVSNAIKYTNPSGKVSFTAEVVIKDDGKQYIRYTIADTGVGMSSKFMTHLYEVFSRENNAFSNTEGGTGLGLAIVKKLVDLMAGSIICTSELEIGTVFIVDLPYTKISEHDFKISNGIDSKIQASNNQFGKDLSILLVEDNTINAEIVMQLLNVKGFKVVHCENGKQAVEYIQDLSHPSMFCILMDCRMPIMDGLEATKEIRNLPSKYAKEIPIIGLSANAFEEDRIRAISIGMNEYLTKPIIAKDLFKALLKFL